MEWIDTHAHIYLDQFSEDQESMVNRAMVSGIAEIYLPNIDLQSLPVLLELQRRYPNTLRPMIGLHPCDVDGNWEKVLDEMEKDLEQGSWAGIGETGIDLYWDKTFIEEQKQSFARQIQWATQMNLPVIIHCRDSFDEIFEVCEAHFEDSTFGILHCFTGDLDQAHRAIDLNLKLGIGGVLTFKNGGLREVVREIDMKHLVLETDSPFLAPVPYRGKRNEPSYIPLIGQVLADTKGITVEEVAAITTFNAREIFKSHGSF
jgi:TatD DNase family protein